MDVGSIAGISPSRRVGSAAARAELFARESGAARHAGVLHRLDRERSAACAVSRRLRELAIQKMLQSLGRRPTEIGFGRADRHAEASSNAEVDRRGRSAATARGADLSASSSSWSTSTIGRPFTTRDTLSSGRDAPARRAQQAACTRGRRREDVADPGVDLELGQVVVRRLTAVDERDLRSALEREADQRRGWVDDQRGAEDQHDVAARGVLGRRRRTIIPIRVSRVAHRVVPVGMPGRTTSASAVIGTGAEQARRPRDPCRLPES